MYTIGEISKMFHVPVSTLRYYDKEGLFPNLERSSGIRQFSDKEIETTNLIKEMVDTYQMDKKDDFSEILDEPQRKEPTILDIFNALVFVILLILVTGWIYMKIKKINPEQLLSGKFSKLTENSFKIISSLQLGGGKAIYLIEINNKQLIIGTTSSSVNLLAQMDKSDKNNEIPQECIEKLFNDKTEEFKKLEE